MIYIVTKLNVSALTIAINKIICSDCILPKQRRTFILILPLRLD